MIRITRRLTLVALTLAASAVLSGCTVSATAPSTPSTSSQSADVGLPAAAPAPLPQFVPGRITIDGDRGTLTPDERSAYLKTGAIDTVSESFNGNAQAYQELCAGEIDIADSVQPISASQIAKCHSNGLNVVQFEVAADAVVIGIENETDVGGDCLSTTQLHNIFRAGSPVARWSDLGSGYLDLPLSTGGAGSPSSDFELFGQQVLGVSAPAAVNFRGGMAWLSSDSATRTWLVGTTNTPTETYTPKNRGRVAYFQYSYYGLYEEQIRPFEITLPGKTQNCVFPSPETIGSGTYPISERYLITTTTRSLGRSEVRRFMTDYLDNADTLASNRQLLTTSASLMQQQKLWAAGTSLPQLVQPTGPSASPTPQASDLPAS